MPAILQEHNKVLVYSYAPTMTILHVQDLCRSGSVSDK